LPQLKIIYGGVFPTYHFLDILEQEQQIDIVVRGEGEETLPKLMTALENTTDLNTVEGIAFRQGDRIVETPPAHAIQNLDNYRVGKVVRPRPIERPFGCCVSTEFSL